MSRHTPTISVVVPTLNASRFLSHTIASLERSQREAAFDIEIIVVDGGSTDETLEQFERSELERIQILNEPDLNQAAAINHGMSMAQGSILCWLNGDDIHWPGALEYVRTFFENQPSAQFVYGLAVAMDAKGRHYGRRRHIRSGGFTDLLEDDFIVQPASFWTRSLWEDVGPLDATLEYVFDYDFFIRASRLTTLEHVRIPFAGERLHPETKTSGGGLVRIAELETLMERYAGRRHVPAGFVADALAMHLHAAVALTRQGRWNEAVEVLRATPPLDGQRGIAAARSGLTLFGGHGGPTRALLVRNAINARRSGSPLCPPDLDRSVFNTN